MTAKTPRPGGLVMLPGRCEVYDLDGRFYGPYKSLTEAAWRAFQEHDGLLTSALPVVGPWLAK